MRWIVAIIAVASAVFATLTLSSGIDVWAQTGPTPTAIAMPQATSTPAPAPVACTGIAATDARRAAGGVVVSSTPRAITWQHEVTPIEAALATPRLAFRGTRPRVDSRPMDTVTVWHRDATTGAWQSWTSTPVGPFATLRAFEPGETYEVVASVDLDLSLAAVRTSVFSGARIVSLYGHPGVATMGALGTYATAGGAAAAVEDLVALYQPLSGETKVVGALHVITAVAQADAGWDGTYLGRMSMAAIAPYVEATLARGQLLFLDVQVGWSDPLAEVRALEPLLVEPHVHMALDPEFATKAKNWPPGESIGYLTPEQVNDVQHYLRDLSARAGVPSKVLVLHQFRSDMLYEPERIEQVAGVDLVIDMDGWGPPWQKLDGYLAYARAPYAEYAGFKLFYLWDVPVMSPAEVMALAHPPDYLIYQ